MRFEKTSNGDHLCVVKYGAGENRVEFVAKSSNRKIARNNAIDLLRKHIKEERIRKLEERYECSSRP